MAHETTAERGQRVTTKGFAILPHEVSDTVPQEIKGAVRSVYPALHRRGWGSAEGCWASIKSLQDESGFGRHSVIAALRWLVAEGWVTKEERPGYTCVYRVRIDDPQPPEKKHPVQKRRGSPRPKTEGVPTPKTDGVPRPKTDYEQEPSNKNPLTTKEPPTHYVGLPPEGDTHGSDDDWPEWCVAWPSACASGTLVEDPQPQRPDPAPSPPKRTPMAKPRAFVPTPDDIPASLLPVEAPLMAFWQHKQGQRTQQAWNCLTGALERIWRHPDGGIDAVRDQIDNATQAGWRSITFANWQKYGTRPLAPIGGSRRKSSTEAAADAVIAFYNSMESA